MPEGDVGFHHAAVRAARRLHQKKHRQEERCFLFEGPQLLDAALNAGARIERLFALRGALSVDLAARVADANIEVLSVDRRTLDSLSQTAAPSGIVAVAAFVHLEASRLVQLLVAGKATVVVLPDLSDPGNAGTLIRSAEAFGARAVCFGPTAVEPYNDKVVRSSMGSIFRVPIIWYRSWEELKSSLTQTRMAILGTAADGVDVRSVTLPERVALVVGQEQRGLAEVPRSDFELVVGVPHAPDVESLNAGVAGSILLYELSRTLGLVQPDTARTTDL